MQSPKTTLSGILVLIGSITLFVAHWLGGSLSIHDAESVLVAIVGLGLIGAADQKS